MMTNGDKIKLRAELAGKAMQGMLTNSYFTEGGSTPEDMGKWAAQYADALMAELGISMEDDK